MFIHEGRGPEIGPGGPGARGGPGGPGEGPEGHGEGPRRPGKRFGTFPEKVVFGSGTRPRPDPPTLDFCPETGLWDVPEAVERPQRLWHVPQRLWDVPQRLLDVPQYLWNVPQSLLDVPQSLLDVPQSQGQ